jgi:hypothetical protein
MPPPGPQPSRRHPDFVKDQQSYQYGQQRPQIYGTYTLTNLLIHFAIHTNQLYFVLLCHI